jgi:probable HAF family extracellular repeat protein
MTALPTLGGNNGFATSVNSSGQVVGWAENTVHDPTCVAPQVLQFEAVVWGPGQHQMQQLPPYSGDPDGAATGINDNGQVIGISGICQNAVGNQTAIHALLWQHGTVTNLGNLGGFAWNTPMALNNHGQIVGFSDLPGDQHGANPNFHAFLWTQSRGIQDLGTLPGDAISEALGINDQGQVVGVSYGAGFTNPRAFLWQDGVMTDLNTLIPSGSSLYLQAAQEINDLGEIVGQASDQTTGNAPAFLLIPR